MKIIYLFLFSIIFMLTMSCRPEEVLLSPDLPPTPVLTSDSLWGVANKPYQKVLSEPEGDAEVSGLLRQGDIVEVISKVSDKDARFYWLEVRSSETGNRGWVPDGSLNVYDSPAQARTAGEALDF